VPIDNTWAEKFGIMKYEKYGFDVQIWSAEELFYSDEKIADSAGGSDNYKFESVNIRKVRTFDDLEKKVCELDSATLLWIVDRGPIDALNFDNRDLDIFNKYNVKYVCQHLIPYLTPPRSWLKIKYYARELKRRIYNYKKKPCLMLGTGSEGRKQVIRTFNNNFIYKSVPSLNILWLHEELEVNKKYIVYVDEAMNHSPDAALFGQENPCHDVEGFYYRINKVFEQIESWTGFQVVIAASGKYHYTTNPFKNRKIIYRKTANLIQHSEMVLGHKSLGLEQAIVENKPLLLFYDLALSELKNKHIHDLAVFYGVSPIWTNQLSKIIFEYTKRPNILRNKEILKNYLKEDGVSGTFVENVASAFNQI